MRVGKVRRSFARRASALLFVGAVALGSATRAHASHRPGGGSSFSGGSSSRGGSFSGSSHGSSSWSSGGGSYGSGSGDLGLIGLLISNGLGGFSFVGFVAFLIVVSLIMKRRGLALDWQAGVGDGGGARRERIRGQLEQIRAQDPNFSLVLLDDFLYALYAQAHTLRGAGALERLSAYLKPPARAALTSLGQVREVRGIIVGAMRYVAVEGADGNSQVVRLVIEFESNYTDVPVQGPEQSYYARETWTLSRARGVVSRTPDRVRVFTCPSCGAPLDSMVGGRCQYCQATVDTGQLDWVVEGIAMASREARGPILTGTTEEQGTDMPTIVDRDVQARFAQLAERDPQFVWAQFQARVAMIFGAMQVSWSNREWAQVRPFVSDNLFQMLAYWIEAYKRAHLRNITEGARVEQIELARVASDKFYDALTVRLFASSLDYTIADADGRVVGGNRSRPRRYSEYWTLIRGASRKGPSRTDAACPSCGAPLRIEMAGHCEYCRAKVTSGEFDWVLSRIEQDDVYEG
jgi:hypothetical protein